MRRIPVIVGTAAVVVLAGGAALAGTLPDNGARREVEVHRSDDHGPVGTTPSTVVDPTTSTIDDRGGEHDRGDDQGDDRGDDATTSTTAATSPTTDDHGGDRPGEHPEDAPHQERPGDNHGGRGAPVPTTVAAPAPVTPPTTARGGHDDGPGHDQGDDHGGRREDRPTPTPTPTVTTAPAHTTTTVDDHGGGSGHGGGDDSGSGHGGGGGDDGSGHR